MSEKKFKVKKGKRFDDDYSDIRSEKKRDKIQKERKLLKELKKQGKLEY